MSWMDTPLLQRMERFLDMASLRQSLISSNIANLDTPGAGRAYFAQTATGGHWRYRVDHANNRKCWYLDQTTSTSAQRFAERPRVSQKSPDQSAIEAEQHEELFREFLEWRKHQAP